MSEILVRRRSQRLSVPETSSPFKGISDLISLSLKSWVSYPKKSKSKLGKAIRLKLHRPPTTRRKYIDTTKYKGLRVILSTQSAQICQRGSGVHQVGLKGGDLEVFRLTQEELVWVRNVQGWLSFRGLIQRGRLKLCKIENFQKNYSFQKLILRGNTTRCPPMPTSIHLSFSKSLLKLNPALRKKEMRQFHSEEKVTLLIEPGKYQYLYLWYNIYIDNIR